jgi:hypothetical protein
MSAGTGWRAFWRTPVWTRDAELLGVHPAPLLDRLAARPERMARAERYRAEAMASRRRES